MAQQSVNIFLLIGQSNMAARCEPAKVPLIYDKRILMFRDDEWIQAEDPAYTDKPEAAGSGIGMGFAFELVTKYPQEIVGLVPCAVGGTPLSRWMPENDLYLNALSTVRKAMTKGKLKGVLFHQGESDSNSQVDASTYEKRFKTMVISLREQLSDPDLPVISGELGMFIEKHERFNYFRIVNKALNQLQESLPFYSCASSAGLKDKGDNLHFDSQSLREFGKRYLTEFLKVAAKKTPPLI